MTSTDIKKLREDLRKAEDDEDTWLDRYQQHRNQSNKRRLIETSSRVTRLKKELKSITI